MAGQRAELVDLPVGIVDHLGGGGEQHRDLEPVELLDVIDAFARKFPLKPLVVRETRPGPEVLDETEEYLRWIQRVAAATSSSIDCMSPPGRAAWCVAAGRTETPNARTT